MKRSAVEQSIPELVFSRSIDGIFFMMLDEPVRWDDSVDKDAVLEWVFEHQRITAVNDAMLVQYGATREQFLGLRPVDLLSHDLDAFAVAWRRLFDAGQVRLETEERTLDGREIWIEGDYICLYDEEGRITGHFGIQRDVTERRRRRELLETQNLYLREERASELSRGEILGASPAMRKIFRDISLVAPTEAAVLLLGETGTGKELIARAIHRDSPRADAVLVRVNCGALPTGLAESELFGHERGAFTGATQQKKGRFELAHGGTIFLDEVGELPADLQVKLLHVLQEQEFERVGGTRTLRSDARVVAATNRELQQEVEKGAFRADLFYRLNTFPIEVPPLRERKEDIPALAHHFVREYALRAGRRIEKIDNRTLDRLHSYDWPGNVRELGNVLERAVILCPGAVLRPEHVGALGSGPVSPDGFPTLEEMERRHILEALERTGGVIAGPRGAARLLGMHRSTLWSRMRKLGLHSPRS